MIDCDVVISRYKENLSWLDRLTSGRPIIYNKSDEPTGYEEKFAVSTVKNVGREAETYVRYVVERYETLPEYVAFVQGEPFEHCHHLVEILNSFKGTSRAIPLSSNWKREVPMGGYNWEGFADAVAKMSAIVGLPYPAVHAYGTGAQYLVPREVIRARPYSFYKELLSHLDYSPRPHEAWVMERLWPTVFGIPRPTDHLHLDIVLVGDNLGDDSRARDLRERAIAQISLVRPDIRCFVRERSSLDAVILNAQDFVIFLPTEQILPQNFFLELIETYMYFKMDIVREDDMVLGFMDDPELYTKGNIEPVRVLRASERYWREGSVSSRSYMTHVSILKQYAVTTDSETFPETMDILLQIRAPYFTPMPSMIRETQS
jgi:hypothetical protein